MAKPAEHSIQIEYIPHNGKSVTKIVCSPNMEYIATWSSKDYSIVGWSIDDEQLQPKYMISEKIKNTLYPKKAADGSEKVANSSKKVADGYDKLHKLYMSDAEGCNYSKLFTVSDNKLVLMRILDSENLSEKDLKNPSENDQKNLDENDPKNPNENYPNENDPVMIGIFDLETKKHYLPTSTQITIKVSQSAFMKNGDVIMIDFDASSVHILTPKKTQIKIGKTIEFFQLVYKSAMSFKRLPNTKVFVTPNEKLLIYDRSRFGSGSITKWDLKTSLFEAQFFLSNVYEVHDVKLNYNESLLLVYTTKYVEKKETNITVYLAGNGMKLVTYNLKTKIIDVFDIIASEFGERLLVISHEPHDDKSTNYELLDPYIDAESIKADKLFDVSSFDFKRPCIVTFSRIDRIDRIIGLIDEKLSIKKLIRKNWIKYLRKELKDYNRITIPSGGKIVGSMVKNIINDSNTLTSNKIDNLINGNLVEWTLTCGSGKALLRAKSLNISDERDINLDIWKNKQFLMQLNNDDLVIITRLHNDDLIIINVFIWTFKKKIKLIYYYSYEGKNIQEIFKIFNENIFSDRFLPPPYFMIHSFRRSFGDQEANNLFEELLETYVNEEFYLIIYGNDLMKRMVDINETKIMERLYKRIFEINFKKNDPNIQLFSIISQSITKLSRENSMFVTDFMSEISFFITSDKYLLTQILEKGTSEHHLHHTGFYNRLTTSFFTFKYFVPLEHYMQKLSNIYFLKNIKDYYEKHFVNYKHFVILTFPLAKFVTYPRKYNFWKELLIPEPSCFAESTDPEFYKTWNGEALLKFKWNTFGRKYYFLTWAIYTAFLCCFVIVTTLSSSISWNYKQFFLIITIFIGSGHLFHEFRQFIYSPLNYLSSIWNYIDLGAIISTIVISIQWLNYGTVSSGAVTFSILLLELKFIVFFRAIPYFGIYIAMIMNTVDKVLSFLIIFGLIIFVFAHSLHLLLRSMFEPFQDQDTNIFEQFGSAILASYYIMITGDSTPLSAWISRENIITMLFMIVFSFLVTIYLMNLFIGILSNLVGDTEDNQIAYMKLKKEIIEEIELFCLLPHQRRKYNWFPDTFNYIVHVNELIKKIESDEQKLSKKLYISPTLLDMIKRESNNEIQESDKLNKLQKEMEEIKMILNEIRNNKIENKNIEMEEIKTILNEIRNNKIENKNIENKTEN